METGEQKYFVVINNIPRFYHSSDLRNFFSEHVELGSFLCFHFKHRPEIKVPKATEIIAETSAIIGITNLVNHENDKLPTPLQTPDINSCCCIAQMKQDRIPGFSRMYHKKHWLDRKGNSIPSLCSVSQIKVAAESDGSQKYKTKAELKKLPTDRDSLTLDELEKMHELQPPFNVMPNGNVGTPTKVFLELINQCKLPPKVISKLGLTFPKSRRKHRYESVPFDYPKYVSKGILRNKSKLIYRTSKERAEPGKNIPDNSSQTQTRNGDDEEEIVVKSASGHVIESESDFKLTNSTSNKAAESATSASEAAADEETQSGASSADDDDDGCEEWERHIALTDDAANVERNKDRLFEEKIELKWEKGGSGLVFYTDAQFWKEKEGDFDEQTTDDWDVDMSIYYEENGGDRDSRDLVSMRQSKRRRDGIEATDLKTLGFHKDSARIGPFERYSKGIGRKVLERQGWSEGQGLGASTSGISETIDSDGQNPKDKRGLGFYGEALQRTNFIPHKKKKSDVLISTIYDNTAETDPTEPLLRRNEPYQLKHRHVSAPYQAFQKPADPDLQVLR